MSELPINQIIHGDCLEVMKDWPDGCVDLVLTDPPYGIGYNYNKYEDSLENLKSLIIPVIVSTFGLASRTATFCGLRHCFEYPKPKWIISWNWRGTNTYGDYGVNQWQPILCYGKDIKGFGSINGIIKSDSIYYEGGNCDEKKCFEQHPCPKNIGIMTRLVQRLSNEGDLILDPFCGSGTTCVAAKMLGRSYIGIDISAEYVDIARKRLEAVDTGVPVKERDKGQIPLFGAV